MTNYLFAIQNTQTKKFYLGISTNAYSTRDTHYRLLKTYNLYFIREMRQDFLKHGMEAMKFVILDSSDKREDLCNIGMALLEEAPENFYNQSPQDFFLN